MSQKIIASLLAQTALLAYSAYSYSAETIELSDVVVTANRVAQSRESVIGDVSVIEQAQIERTGQSTLVELLAQQPGIEITSSGGAGSASGILMRGTNSGSVVVLIDGLRIDSVTLGSTAFENLPLGQIEKIEILRGPATSLYGQDAIGGVIQIFTKKGIDGATKFNANFGYGTYDTVRADAGLSGKISSTRFALNASSLKTNSFSAIKTKNTDYDDNDANRNLAFSGNLAYEIESGHEIGFQFLHSAGRVHFDNSCPLDENFDCIKGRFDSLSDAKQFTFAVFSQNQFTDSWLSKVRIGQGVDESRTFDVKSVNGGDFYQTKQLQINWQNDFKLPLGTFTLMYDGLLQKINSSIKYDVKERENDGFVASYLLNTSAQSLQMSLRRDSNSQFGGKTTGNVGYGLSFNPNWRITTSFGTAYKAPNFNDLYYPFFGNPNLNPEESRNIEASIRYQTNNTIASATVYHNKVRNLISYNVASNSLLNIKQATLNGFSFNANQQFDSLTIGGNIDIQSPTDDETNNLLVRRANRHAAANISYTIGDWRFGAETIASTIRYNDVANTIKLGGYALLNATVNYQMNKDWLAQARANNVLDKDYALGADFGGEFYNTPGANLFVNVRWQPQ